MVRGTSETERPRMELDRKVETGETAKLVARIAALEQRLEAVEAIARAAQLEIERLRG